MVGHRPITRSLVKQGFPLETPAFEKRNPKVLVLPSEVKRLRPLSDRFFIALFFLVVFSSVHFLALLGIHWYLPGNGVISSVILVLRGIAFTLDNNETLYSQFFDLQFEQPLVIIGYYVVAFHILLLITILICFAFAACITKIQRYYRC